MNRDGIKIWSAYTAMCLIWGTTWLAIKISLHTIGPITGVGLRFLLAGVLLYAIAALRREVVPLRNLPWKVVGVLAALQFGAAYVLNYVAETRLDSGLVAVLFGTVPFFTFGLAHVMIGERATPRIWAGAVIAFAGVALISLSGAPGGSLIFALASVGAAGSAAYSNVYVKRYAHQAPIVTLPPSMTIGGLGVLALGLMFERTHWSDALSAPSLAALLYLAVLGSCAGFLLLMWLLPRLPASTIGLSSLIFPAIALVVGAAFGGEHITLRELMGAALIVAGLWVALARLSSRNDPKSVEVVASDV